MRRRCRAVARLPRHRRGVRRAAASATRGAGDGSRELGGSRTPISPTRAASAGRSTRASVRRLERRLDDADRPPTRRRRSSSTASSTRRTSQSERLRDRARERQAALEARYELLDLRARTASPSATVASTARRTLFAFALDAASGRAAVARGRSPRNEHEGIDMAPGYHDGTVFVSTVPTRPEVSTARGARGRPVGARRRHRETALDAGTQVPADLWGHPSVNSGGGLWHTPAFDGEGTLFAGVAQPGAVAGHARAAVGREPARARTDGRTRSSSSTSGPAGCCGAAGAAARHLRLGSRRAR